MNADWLQQVFEKESQESAYRTGDFIFRLGDAPRYLYLVVSGEARAQRYSPDGAEIVMQRARTGELFAEAGMVAPRYSCEGYCTQPARILLIPFDKLRARIQSDGEFALRFSQFLTLSLRRQCARYERLRLKRASDRVLHYLNCELTGLAGADLELDIPLADWADDLGLEPETLYRTLAALEKQKLIRREARGRRIHLVGAGQACGT